MIVRLPKNKLKLITLLLISFSLVLYLFETVAFPGFTVKYLSFKPEYAVIPAGLALFFLNLRGRVSDVWVYAFSLAAPLVLSCSVLLVYLDQIKFANFVFSSIHLHPFMLVRLGLVLSIFALLSLNVSFLKRKRAFLLLLLPFWLLLLVAVFYLCFPGIYHYFKIEDSFVEDLTFLVCFLTFLVSMRALWLLFRVKKAVLSMRLVKIVFYLIFMFGSLFAAGEEISWGQRIFKFETPAEVARLNKQQEFNLHNGAFFMESVYYLYAVISFFGIFGWMLAKVVLRYFPETKTAKLLFLFSPPYFLMGFFLPVFLFSLSRLPLGIPELPSYLEESLEFILAAGIMLSVYSSYSRLCKS